MSTVGHRIRELRNQINVSQQMLGEICGVAQTTFQNFEAGKTKPSIEFIDKITTHFSVNVEWFLYGRGPKYREPAGGDSPTEFQGLLREYCQLQQENKQLREQLAALELAKKQLNKL